ncbi:hypothetical protein [Nocardioides zeae]|uniref:Uncharacterized protein n=1 Tax=Nocardioides zeae TaxID=1457234 RepID=A0AAJ1U5A5_9ACTN|nr:hypothetical protein [Nocardioides zeae]MDQ1105493.1 hypothetical protein [Nocardioides zeae]
MTDIQNDGRRLVSRRAVTRTAAWSVPAVAVVSAAPAFASSMTDVGYFAITAHCGTVNGVINSGFDLTAGAVALPAGTIISINPTNGVAVNISAPSGAVELGGGNYALTAALPPNQKITLNRLLNVSAATVTTAVVTLPTGFTSTGNPKTSAELRYAESGIAGVLGCQVGA